MLNVTTIISTLPMHFKLDFLDFMIL